MKLKHAISLIVFFTAFFSLPRARCPDSKRESVVVSGSWSGYTVHSNIGKKFEKATGISVGVIGRRSINFADLAAGRTDILVYSPQPNSPVSDLIRKHFPRQSPQPKRYRLGQFVVGVFVNKSNNVREMNLAQLRDIFSGKITSWKRICRQGGGQITLLGQRDGGRVHQVFRNVVMRGRGMSGGFIGKSGTAAVLAAVAKDENAIGFCIYDKPDNGRVAVVSLRATPRGSFYRPLPDDLAAGQYPLVEDLVIFTEANPEPATVAYLRFACGSVGAEVVRKCSLFAEYDRRMILREKRLAAMKAGKGQPVTISGSGEFSQFVDDLAVEFVKAKSVIRPQYAASGEVSAVGRFALGKTKILMLKNPPGKSAMKVHGQKWDKLWKNRKDKPGEPIRHVIPGRSVAAVVNAANKVKSLSRRQIHDIYRDEITDWRPLLSKPKDKKPRRPQRINTYGLPLHSPDARMFYGRIALPSDEARFTLKKDDAAVLSAMATDTDGIGFVNAAVLPDNPEEAGVKVLAMGAGGSAVRPSAKTVLDKSYPLAGRIYIYLHPEADDTTRGFAEFMATCGRPAGNPYIDVPESAAIVYKSHGLLPPPEPVNK